MISEKAVKQLVLCFIAILAFSMFTSYRLGKLDSSTHQNKVTMDKDFKPNWNEAPAWSTAPAWAKFRAFDIYGWYWYENEPILEKGMWFAVSGRFANAFGRTITPICEPRPSGQSPEQ